MLAYIFRFSHENNIPTRVKTATVVDRVISVSDICADGVANKEMRYMLKAIVHHMGNSPLSGHCFAHVLCKDTNFVIANDGNVQVRCSFQ
jgi:hypothetical protein